MPTDITAQLSANISSIHLVAGSYTYTGNVTVTADLMLDPGVVITLPAGTVLTLNGDLTATARQIFDGSGTVDMNKSRIATARPEWWGAQPNNGLFDCRPALSAALVAHPLVTLFAADYYIATTWKIVTPSRAVIGAGSRWSPTRQGTRIIINSATENVMQVGPDTMPGSINEFLTKVDIKSLSLWRSIAPASPPTGQTVVGATGLLVKHVLDCTFEDVRVDESIVGFHISAAVFSRFNQCVAFRSVAGTGSGEDAFHGFYLNGNVYAPGAAGGNASVYITDCSASTGGPVVYSTCVGMGLDRSFADTFISRFETVGVTKGIIAYGDALNPDLARRKIGNVNLHIHLPILDQCRDRCIEIGESANYAAIEIVDPYLTPAIGALAAIHVHSGGGNIFINGGQMLGFGDAEGGGNCVGILLENQSGVRVSGTKLIGFKRPVALSNCTAFDISPDVSNPNQTGSQAAVSLNGCTRGRVTPFVRGMAGAFPQGVNLVSSGNSRIAIDVTGIDPSTIIGGQANKLLINGVATTTVGVKGNNFVSGCVQ